MNYVVVHKRRTNVLAVALYRDVSASAFTSEIREDKDPASNLLATWDISFLTDGTDGELILKLDNSIVETIDKSIGYMDMKETVGGEPMPVWDDPLEVHFKDPITV